MSDRFESAVCQNCGTGFVVTDNYLELLKRRGFRVHYPPQCPTCFLTHGLLPKTVGTVKWYNPRKRYGFLVAEDGCELFVHQRQILAADAGEFQAGRRVRFHVHHPPKGPEALNVEMMPD